MTTWRKEFMVAFEATGDTFSDIEESTLTDEQWDREFDDGYGTNMGEPFTVWTKERVYFPAIYDGAEWVAWVSRNPDGKPTEHVGGY